MSPLTLISKPLLIASSSALKNAPFLISRNSGISLLNKKIHSSHYRSKEVKLTGNKDIGKPDKVHGSIHWNMERVTAIGLVPLLATTFVMGPSTASDVFLGIVLPFHVHMGFDACITDYFNPTRANATLSKIMTMTLHTSTSAVMIGCCAYNYYDVGMTEFIARLWAA